MSCQRTLPWKNPEDPVGLEPRTPGLRVKHFTTEPRRTPYLSVTLTKIGVSNSWVVLSFSTKWDVVFNPFPNKPNTSLLKTLSEKDKLLITSNFSFSHSAFYLFGELSAIFIIPRPLFGGGYGYSLCPSFRHSIRPSFSPTFLSGAYLQKYLRYQIQTLQVDRSH